MSKTIAVEVLLPALRAAIDDEFSKLRVPPGSCVMTARVLIDALAYFGHHAREQPVKVVTRGLAGSDRGRIVRCAGIGRYGYCAESGFYDGHLLVGVSDLFVDLTLAQFDDGAGSIGLEATWFRSSSLAAGLPQVRAASNGSVAYEPVKDVSHQAIASWKRPGAVRQVTGRVIRIVRSASESA